jgi:tryptophan-rich sensory protein
MGAAVTLAAEKNHRENTNAVALFGYQLLLNFLWTVLFFGLRNPFAAFFELIALVIAVLLTTVSFWRISKTAALLMIPYILWITFASILNFRIWRLNRHPK